MTNFQIILLTVSCVLLSIMVILPIIYRPFYNFIYDNLYDDMLVGEAMEFIMDHNSDDNIFKVLFAIFIYTSIHGFLSVMAITGVTLIAGLLWLIWPVILVLILSMGVIYYLIRIIKTKNKSYE